MRSLRSLLSIVVVMAACSSPAGKNGPGEGGAGGDEPEAGSGGSKPTGGKGGSNTGGMISTGGIGGGGTGGGGGNTGGSMGGTGGSMGGSGGSMGGTGGSMGGSGGSVSASCDYTPKANSVSTKLRFDSITMMGVPITDTAKGSGSKDGIVQMFFIPGRNNEFLLLQKRGRVTHMKIDAESKTAMNIKEFNLTNVDITQDCGLISGAFDPGFAQNKFVYFGHCTGPKASRVVRYEWDGNAFTGGVDIMTWQGAGGPSWHAIGSIGFDPAGNMYVLHGEFTNTAQAQNMNTNLGKMVRIIPSRTAGMGGYTVPADNPYAMDPKPKSAIYIAGIRSPWRGFINNKGQYFIGDVGDTTNERVLLATTKGQNFGWGGCPGGGCTGSITSWRGPQDPYDGDGNPVKESRRGRLVWVGSQYGDCGNDRYGGSMTGVHTFGDYFAGWFRGMVIDDAGKKVKDVNLGDLGAVSSVAQGNDGYLYVTTFGPYDSATTERPGLFRILPM